MARHYILKQDFEGIIPALNAVSRGQSVFGNENVEADEIGLPSEEGLVLPCGATGVKIWKN